MSKTIIKHWKSGPLEYSRVDAVWVLRVARIELLGVGRAMRLARAM